MADPISALTVAFASLVPAAQVAVVIGVAVVATKIAQALGPRPSDIQTGGGIEAARTVTVQSTNEPRRLVFGQPARFAGHVVFYNTSTGGSGMRLRYLWYVVRWCDHPIDGYVAWFIDGDRIEPGDIDGSDFVTLPRFTDADGNRLVKLWHFDGTQTVALADLVNEFPELDSTFVGNDIAYTVFRLETDDSVDTDPNNPTEKVWSKGVPRNFEVELRGLELVDPRIPGVQHSSNPILGLYYYLLNKEYGPGIPSTKITTSYIETGADICDEQVTVWDGAGGTTTQNRYTADGIITTDLTHGEVIEQFRDACAGEVFMMQGQMLLLAGSYRAPTDSLTEADLDIEFESEVLKGDERYNAVEGLFFDEARNGQFVEFPARQDASYQADDKETIWRDLELPMTKDNQSAQRLALIALKRSRQMRSFSAICKQKAVRFGVGDVVDVSIGYMGWAAVPFLVVEMAFQPDGAIRAVFREEMSSVYDYIAPPAGGSEIDEPGTPPTVITGTSAPDPATNLTAQPTNSGPRLSWDNPGELSGLSVEVWRSDDNNRLNATRQAVVSDDRFLDEQTTSSKLYYYWVIIRNTASNITSPWEPSSGTDGVLGVRAADYGIISDPNFDATEPQSLDSTLTTDFWRYEGQEGIDIVATSGTAGTNVLRLEEPSVVGTGIFQAVSQQALVPFVSGQIRAEFRYKASGNVNLEFRVVGWDDLDRTGIPLLYGSPSAALSDTSGSFETVGLSLNVVTDFGKNFAEMQILALWPGGGSGNLDIDYWQVYFE